MVHPSSEEIDSFSVRSGPMNPQLCGLYTPKFFLVVENRVQIKCFLISQRQMRHCDVEYADNVF